MEHLRPLSYEEMCQMELLQAAGGSTTSSAPPAMMPIMVIPTALLPAPIDGAAGGGVPGGGGIGGAAMVEHYYQLQPTHHLLPAEPLPTTATATATANSGELALLQGEQQIPHPSIQHPQQMNILCTGTLGRQRMPASGGGGHNPNINPNPNPSVAATLPRGFQPAAFVTDVESDFEGSECGAGSMTTTCIPHFRFGACGLQSLQQHHQQQDAVVGCGSLAYMMGSGTLGRGRRLAGGQGKPKRVSFKGDNLPPPSPPPPPAVELDENGLPIPGGPGDAGSCSYMHFDNYMDYQVGGWVRGKPKMQISGNKSTQLLQSICMFGI